MVDIDTQIKFLSDIILKWEEVIEINDNTPITKIAEERIISARKELTILKNSHPERFI